MRWLRLLGVLLLLGCESNTLPLSTVQLPDVVVPWDGVVIDLAGYFADPDGDRLIFEVTSDDPSRISAEVEGFSNLRLQQLMTGLDPVLIKVLAIDPMGEQAEGVFTATGAVALYEEWETEAALTEWEHIVDSATRHFGSDFEYAQLDVRDEALIFYAASTLPVMEGSKVRTLTDPIEKDWTAGVSFAQMSDNPSSKVCIGVSMLTEDPVIKQIGFGVNYGARALEIWLGFELPGATWSPYWVELDLIGVNIGLDHIPVWELADYTMTFARGRMVLTAQGADESKAHVLVDIDPTEFDLYLIDFLDIPWPPPDGIPTKVVGLTVEHHPSCGPYPPDLDDKDRREERNNMVVDWVRLERAVR